MSRARSPLRRSPQLQSAQTLELWRARVREVREEAARYVRSTGITQIELARRIGYESHYSVHKFLLPQGGGRWEPQPNERSRRFLERLGSAVRTRDHSALAESEAPSGDPLERSSEEIKVSAHRRHLRETTEAFPNGRALNHYDELIEDGLHWDEPRARFRMATNALLEIGRALYEILDSENWTCPSAALLERRLVDVGRLADRALADVGAYSDAPWVPCLVRHYAARARAAGGVVGCIGSGGAPTWDVALESGMDALAEGARLEAPTEACLQRYQLSTDGDLDNVKKVGLRNYLYLVERALALDLPAARALGAQALDVARGWPLEQVHVVLLRFAAHGLVTRWRELDPAWVDGLGLPASLDRRSPEGTR